MYNEMAAEFHLSIQEAGVYELDAPLIDDANDRKKARAAEAFAVMIKKIQSLSPRIGIRDMSLTVSDECIVEMYFCDIGETNHDNMKRFHKVYDSLDLVIEGIEKDFDGLHEIKPHKVRY
jgi:hypothetical protein